MSGRTGRRYGRWRVLRELGRSHGSQRLLCRCDCGRERVVYGYTLQRGLSKGCHRCGHVKHGHCRGGRQTRIYAVWAQMMARCYNPCHRQYADYGGRGITVCERWHDFLNFLADMGGPAPGLSIDRVNNDGNYEPGNCRWATRSEQNRNRRTKLRIKLGDPKILAGIKQYIESLTRLGMRP